MKLVYANKNMLKFSFKRINILRDKHHINVFTYLVITAAVVAAAAAVVVVAAAAVVVVAAVVAVGFLLF
jgi:hypothetical protein